jgi:hypothetical protein
MKTRRRGVWSRKKDGCIGRVAMAGRGGGWASAAGWGWREADDGYGGEREERKLSRIV